MSLISESQIKRSRGYNAGARIFKNSLKSVLNSCKNSSEERNVHLCSNEIVIESPISNIEDESKPIEKKSYSMNVCEKTYDVQQNTDCISANDNEFPLISGKSKNFECKSHTVNHIYSEDSSFCSNRSDVNNYSLPLTPYGISLSHIIEDNLTEDYSLPLTCNSDSISFLSEKSNVEEKTLSFQNYYVHSSLSMDTSYISSADEYRLPLFSNNDSSWLFSEKSGSDESKPLVLTEDYVSHLYSSGDSLDISNVKKADVNSPSIVAEQSPSSDTDSNSSDKYHTSGYVSSQSDLDSSGLLMSPKDRKCVLKNHISMLKSSTPKNEICSPELRDSAFEVGNNNELSNGINHGRKSLSKIVRNLDCESCEKTEKLYMNAERFQKNRKKTLPDYDASSLYTMKSTTGFYDSHCHLDFLFTRTNYYGTFADYQVENKDTFPNIYRGCIAVFCKPWTFAKRHIWQKHLSQNNIWGAFGCHPHEAAHYDDSIENDLKLALTHPKVKALGEIGLDYSSRNNCSKEIQHTVFKRQLEIARNSKLPLVIHCRDANQDCINILKTFILKDTVFHLHCFTDNWSWAEKWMEAFSNVHIGITNLVTFESAKDTHEVARKIPLNRLLLETDTPYFIPRKSPFGTKYSHPGMAIHVAAQIAALRGIEVDEVIQSTCRNTKFVYNLP